MHPPIPPPLPPLLHFIKANLQEDDWRTLKHHGWLRGKQGWRKRACEILVCVCVCSCVGARVCVWVLLPPPGRLSGTSGPRFWPETQPACCLSASAQPGSEKSSLSLASFQEISLIFRRNKKSSTKGRTFKGPIRCKINFTNGMLMLDKKTFCFLKSSKEESLEGETTNC